MAAWPENYLFNMEQTVAELPVLDRAWAWFAVKKNRQQVIWGGGVVLVVVLAVSFYFWRKNEIEFAASDALSRVEAQLTVPGGARNESAEAYLKVANEHAGTGAGARALLQAGVVFFTQAKYSDAQAQFQKFGQAYPESPFRGQAVLGNAACLDALGKSDEAAAAYKSFFEQRPNEAGSLQAKFSLARIYESQGKLEQARTLYEELARGDANAANSSIGNEAGLKAEELRSKLPASPPPNAIAAPPMSLLNTPPAVSTNKP
jgi:tetratricopeptide (TPR) repeat protein